MGQLQIVLADDHALVTEGLKSLIDQQADMTVVQTVQNGDELLEFWRAIPMSILPWSISKCPTAV
ncbi:MAG: hypothetical protein R2932_16265 [Caldilineaceae bacterium]